MADKAIKVAVLEGDFASLCALGFPLPLSLQLQQSCLRLNETMWTAKSSSGGFLSASSGLPLIVKSASPANCSPSLTHCYAKESCLKHYSDSEKEQQWTQVTGRRRRARLPPCWKMKFPAHLQANLHTPTSSSATDESSEGEESKDADDGKGPQCAWGSESTPVAARTRSKLKT